jgi:Ca2+-binding EF-hand superfamily protein
VPTNKASPGTRKPIDNRDPYSDILKSQSSGFKRKPSNFSGKSPARTSLRDFNKSQKPNPKAINLRENKEVEVPDIPDKTKEQKEKEIKRNKRSLKDYLGNYSESFSKDVDELWKLFDADKNNFLDESEAYEFVKELSKCIFDAERGANLTVPVFRNTFEEFDEDKNGYLTKAEMAVLIKKVFKKNSAQAKMEETNMKNTDSFNLKSLLGEYA